MEKFYKRQRESLPKTGKDRRSDPKIHIFPVNSRGIFWLDVFTDIFCVLFHDQSLTSKNRLVPGAFVIMVSAYTTGRF